MEIETVRLILRPLRAEDAEVLARMWADPDVTRYVGGPRNFDEVRASFEEDARMDPPPRFDLWPVVDKATGQVVGHCGLLDKEVGDRQEHELVYFFTPAVWGQGYATEMAGALKEYAFRRLGLDRVVSLIDPANAASEHVALKLGLRHENDALRPGGKYMRVYAATAPSR